MAVNLQIGFNPQKPDAANSTPTSPSYPSLRRDNSNSRTIGRPEVSGTDNHGQNDLSELSPALNSRPATARWLALTADETRASALPNVIPPPDAEGAEADKATLEDDQPNGSAPSRKLEEFIKNRRPSISFNPQVTLESGQQRKLEAPLPKLEIDTRKKSRAIIQDLTRSVTRSPILRAYSETERSNYDPETGQRRDPRSPQLRSPPTALFPILQPPVDRAGCDENQPDFQASGSLTSESTASSGISEARTPTEVKMETCMISPISTFPPFYPPTSLEDTSAWPKAPRQASASRSKSYSIENKMMGRRQSSRQGSIASRRSTSSAMSPATAFLSRFAREEAVVEPDGEGQEVGDYILGKQIGFGGFSVVREAFTIEGEERVTRAVKIVRKQVVGKEEFENDQLQAEFEHEVGLWRCLGHRHILPLIAVHHSEFATFCFTKLNTGGTLFDLVRANRKGISQELARRYSYQLASAIRYLHEDMHVVHRDIKLENCLIDLSLPEAAKDGGNLLLCDFGLAEFATNENGRNSPDPYEDAADRPEPKHIGPSDTSTSIAGSLQYASPELIISPAGFLSSVVDVWAFGVVVYALLVGDLPFQHTFQPRVQMMILAGEWNQEALRNAGGTQGMEDEVLDFVHGCLDMNSERRWNIATVLKSGWLQGCQEMLEEVNEKWRL